MRSGRPLPRRARHAGAQAGFTLVEVMVALFAMAVIAALAWRGIDGVVRSRDAGRESVERTVRLGTVMAQWERDLAALHDSPHAPALAFDGRTLRLTRSVEGGVAVVAWSLQGAAWVRWAGPAVTRTGELREQWLRSLQLQGTEPGQVRLLDGVDTWTVYCFRGNGWSHCQSTGDVAETAERPASAASGANGARDAVREALPGAVRLDLGLAGQRLQRDIALGPQVP
jgi:general secretion pathway protein J